MRLALAIGSLAPKLRLGNILALRWDKHIAPRVYILRCADASLYVGHTDDLNTRERTHNEGRGGTYTAQRKPVRLIYSEEFATLGEARNRERQLKRC